MSIAEDDLAGSARRRTHVRNRREKGMALAIALIVLLLMSIMIAGLAWLMMTDQKLGGNNADRQRAFYGSEAGLESLTASLENAFNAKYTLTASDIKIGRASCRERV